MTNEPKLDLLLLTKKNSPPYQVGRDDVTALIAELAASRAMIEVLTKQLQSGPPPVLSIWTGLRYRWLETYLKLRGPRKPPRLLEAEEWSDLQRRELASHIRQATRGTGGMR